MRKIMTAALGAATMLVGQTAYAHPHQVVTPGNDGQVIADGQNHPRFIDGISCEWYGAAAGGDIGPAWYGLETAHHGPDAGDAGRGDGCYETTGAVPPGQDVQSPVIR